MKVGKFRIVQHSIKSFFSIMIVLSLSFFLHAEVWAETDDEGQDQLDYLVQEYLAEEEAAQAEKDQEASVSDQSKQVQSEESVYLEYDGQEPGEKGDEILLKQLEKTLFPAGQGRRGKSSGFLDLSTLMSEDEGAVVPETTALAPPRKNQPQAEAVVGTSSIASDGQLIDSQKPKVPKDLQEKTDGSTSKSSILQGTFLTGEMSSSNEFLAESEFQELIEEDIHSSPKSIFNFHEHLSSAQAAIIDDHEGYQTGVWGKDQFVFPDYSKQDSIRLEKGIFNGVKRQGIVFQPVKNGKKRLRYNFVPPGRELIVHYGIHDFGVSDEVQTFSYLKIWAGEHFLGKIRIQNEKGWKQLSFDLGIVEFLKQAIIITFEVSADDISGQQLFIRPEIL